MDQSADFTAGTLCGTKLTNISESIKKICISPMSNSSHTMSCNLIGVIYALNATLPSDGAIGCTAI